MTVNVPPWSLYIIVDDLVDFPQPGTRHSKVCQNQRGSPRKNMIWQHDCPRVRVEEIFLHKAGVVHGTNQISWYILFPFLWIQFRNHKLQQVAAHSVLWMVHASRYRNHSCTVKNFCMKHKRNTWNIFKSYASSGAEISRSQRATGVARIARLQCYTSECWNSVLTMIPPYSLFRHGIMLCCVAGYMIQ